jgi:phosphoglycerate dehydrogenase-like enzyme
MRVLAVRHSGKPVADDPARAEVHPPEALPELLPQANVLMITLPHTDETDGLIGAADLDMLPDRAILVNVGRGAVVDQGALYHALKDGKLHSAGIDVWYHYPSDEESRANTPPADYPFHTLENIVMSPHRGGGSMEVEVIRLAAMADTLNAAARGEEIPNRVDLERGY